MAHLFDGLFDSPTLDPSLLGCVADFMFLSAGDQLPVTAATTPL
jgi:hypothetical protein